MPGRNEQGGDLFAIFMFHLAEPSFLQSNNSTFEDQKGCWWFCSALSKRQKQLHLTPLTTLRSHRKDIQIQMWTWRGSYILRV